MKKNKEGLFFILKRWYNLARPNKKNFFIQLLTCLIATGCMVLVPVLSAKVINYLYLQDFNQAIIWLAISLALIVFRQLIWHFNFINYTPLIKSSYQRIQNKIFDKIISAEEKGLKQFSREKLINMVNSDISEIAKLSDTISSKGILLVRVFIFTVLIFTINIWAGIMSIGIVAINYFIIDALSNRLGKSKSRYIAHQDEITETFSNIVRGRNVLKDFGLTKELKQDYIEKNEKFHKERVKYYKTKSLLENWNFAFWNALTTAVSVFLVILISKDAMTIESYLIVTGYIASCIQASSDSLNVFLDIYGCNVNTMRVDTFLKFEDKQLIEFGNNDFCDIYDELSFNKVCFNSSKINEKTGSIKDASFSIAKNSLSIIYGPEGCGKRALFYMVKRILKPDSGTVSINGISASEYSEKAYKNIVSHASYDPFFFSGNIMQNFMTVNKNKGQIEQVCKILKIDSFIKSLPDGYNTDILKHMDKLTPKNKFLMGFAMAMLAGSRFILIYGVPYQMNAQEKQQLNLVFEKIKKVRTIIMVLPKKQFIQVADNIIFVDDGKIKYEKKMCARAPINLE